MFAALKKAEKAAAAMEKERQMRPNKYIASGVGSPPSSDRRRLVKNNSSAITHFLSDLGVALPQVIHSFGRAHASFLFAIKCHFTVTRMNQAGIRLSRARPPCRICSCSAINVWLNAILSRIFVEDATPQRHL